mmetsp:Transcript_8133/g.24291  ORF Transcript_8133/g.24291 Transcript_8133/m.24291 type:complete len:207 (-) Transcript_8133:533-1153(-)
MRRVGQSYVSMVQRVDYAQQLHESDHSPQAPHDRGRKGRNRRAHAGRGQRHRPGSDRGHIRCEVLPHPCLRRDVSDHRPPVQHRLRRQREPRTGRRSQDHGIRTVPSSRPHGRRGLSSRRRSGGRQHHRPSHRPAGLPLQRNRPVRHLPPDEVLDRLVVQVGALVQRGRVRSSRLPVPSAVPVAPPPHPGEGLRESGGRVRRVRRL